MSVSTLESPASLRELDRIHDEAQEYTDRVFGLRCQFVAAAMAGRMDAVAGFAPSVVDARLKREGGGYATRPQRVGEVLAESLDLTRGPDFDDALSLICAMARGEWKQIEARELLDRMAAAWVEAYVGEVL